MKYEYYLYSLETWLKENKQLRLTLQDEPMNMEFTGKLEMLEAEFQKLPVEKFEEWVAPKSKKEKRLIPYLYKQDLEGNIKSKLLTYIGKQIEDDKRLFRVVVDVSLSIY